MKKLRTRFSPLVRRAARTISPSLAALLLLAGPLAAQSTAPPRGLQIVIMEGEGALNNIQERTAREPIVQVQDENHKPVAGAAVLFAIHGGDGGAGASFAGASQLTVTTGPDGTAAAHGLVVNQHSGAWQIAVTATDGGLSASTVINEINLAPVQESSSQGETPTSFHAMHWWLSKPALLAGGAAVVGAVITVVIVDPPGGGGTVITPGGSTVGPPASAGVRLRFGRR